MDTPPDSATPRHPIAIVAERTRLSQDVLRVWERRYGAVTPVRSPGGQRLYSDDDITRLRLLHAATLAGRAISQVASLALPDLRRMVDEDAAGRTLAAAAELAPAMASGSDLVAASLALTVALDGPGLEAELRRAASVHGSAVFLDGVVSPLLQRIGEEWHAGRLTPAQEHLATATLQTVMADVVRSVGRVADGPRLVLATPSGERHAIGAMLAGAAAATDGWRVTCLGPDLPAADVAAAAESLHADAVGMSVIYLGDRDRTLEELRALRRQLRADVPLLVGGGGAVAMSQQLERAGILVLTGLDDLRVALARIRSAK